jgi:diguanylate cyclase (GGDEF)-like protein
MVSHGAPVYWDNEFVGVVATDLQLDFLNVFLRHFPDPEGVLTISNAQGQILGDRSVKTAAGPAGIKMVADMLPVASHGAVGQLSLQGVRMGNDMVFSSRLEDPRWTIRFELPQATINARVAQAFAAKFCLLLVLVIGSFVIQFVLWRMYVSPALQIADFVAQGGTGTQLPALPQVPSIWRPWFAAMSRAFGERQRYLAELQASHTLLDQRVQERTHELLMANNKLKGLSVTDALTGAFNRRYLFDVLETECQRIARGGETLSVLMLDLDHFKTVNDQHGHAAGDAVLREFVRRCLELVRKTDMVCRYGGEEFVVFMPTMNCDGAVLLAQRLCHSIAATPVPFEGRLIEVTVSIGVTSYRHPESVAALLARADQLMYSAKHAGRNRVVSGM